MRRLLLLALLSGCGAAADSALGETAEVAGQIDGYSLGAGYAFTITLAGKDLASGPIDDTGRFRVALPTAAQVAPYLSPLSYTNGVGCQSQVTVSPDNATTATVAFVAVSAADRRGLRLARGTLVASGASDDTVVNYSYAPAETRALGSATCPALGGPASQTTVDLLLRKGWNTVQSRTVGDLSSLTGTVRYDQRSAPPDSDQRWRLSR